MICPCFLHKCYLLLAASKESGFRRLGLRQILSSRGWNSEISRELPRDLDSKMFPLRILSLRIDRSPTPSFSKPSFSRDEAVCCGFAFVCNTWANRAAEPMLRQNQFARTRNPDRAKAQLAKGLVRRTVVGSQGNVENTANLRTVPRFCISEGLTQAES